MISCCPFSAVVELGKNTAIVCSELCHSLSSPFSLWSSGNREEFWLLYKTRNDSLENLQGGENVAKSISTWWLNLGVLQNVDFWTSRIPKRLYYLKFARPLRYLCHSLEKRSHFNTLVTNRCLLREKLFYSRQMDISKTGVTNKSICI